MYLFYKHRQWTEATKGELNLTTQNSIQSPQQNQTLHHGRFLIR